MIIIGIFSFSICNLSLMNIKSRIVKFGAYLRLVCSRNLSLVSNLELEPAHIITRATALKHKFTFTRFYNYFSFLIKFVLFINCEIECINEIRDTKFLIKITFTYLISIVFTKFWQRVLFLSLLNKIMIKLNYLKRTKSIWSWGIRLTYSKKDSLSF